MSQSWNHEAMSASMPKDMRHIKTIIIAQRVYKQAPEGWWVKQAGNHGKPRVK